MAMRSMNIDATKDCDAQASPPEKNLCYMAPEDGTFWLQGKEASGEGESRATFVWYHDPNDIDSHSEQLIFQGVCTYAALKFWCYLMHARNEDGSTTPVYILLQQGKSKDKLPVFYQRNGKGTAESPKDSSPVLWAWEATLFEGHEDQKKST